MRIYIFISSPQSVVKGTNDAEDRLLVCGDTCSVLVWWVESWQGGMP